MLYYLLRSWWRVIFSREDSIKERSLDAAFFTFSKEGAAMILEAAERDLVPSHQLYPDTLPEAPFTPPGA